VENNEWTMQILDPVLGFSTRFPNSRPAAQQ
jgi:hypothetical protein